MPILNGWCRFVCLLLQTVLASTAAAQSAPRILVVGDSWGQLTTRNKSIETDLSQRGIESARMVRGISVNGSTAAQWASQPSLERITDELTRFPTIDIVHLVVGGNDMFSYFHGDRTAEENEAFYDRLTAHIQTIVIHILAIRKDVQVLLADYDYVMLWQRVSDIRVQNEFFAGFARARRDIARRTPRMSYLSNWGLLHATFGFPPHFEAGEYPFPGSEPDYEPLMGGNPDFGGDPRWFIDEGHLTPRGFLELARRAVDEYYLDWLESPITHPFVRGDANTDGEQNLADAIFVLEHLFGVGEEPSCVKSADANDSGKVDITDPVYLLNFLFTRGPPPPAPFSECGPDLTIDELSCESFQGCG